MRGVLCIALVCLVTAAQAKRITGQVEFSAFNQSECVYFGRFGSETKKYAVNIRRSVYGVYASEKAEYGKNLSLRIVGVNAVQHKKMKDEASSDKLESDYLGLDTSKLPNVEFDLQEDGEVEGFIEHTEVGIHYFYLCDVDRLIREYIRVSESEEKAENESKENVGFFGGLIGKLFKMKATTVGYTIDLLSMVDSERKYHHSVEQSQTDKVCMIFFVLFAVLGYYLAKKIMKYYAHNEKVDYPLLLIALSVALQNISLVWKFFHYWSFSSTGEDSHFLEISCRMFNLFSDMFLSTLLIMMSKGFGVIEIDFVSDYIAEFAIGLVVLAFRYVWVFIGLIYMRDNDDVYHIYDGVTGKLELLNTVVLYIWFVISVSMMSIFRTSKFMNLRIQLIIYGTVYLCINPVLILLVYLVDPMHQHQLSTIIALGSQLIVCGMMAYSFTNKKGVYMNISLSNSLELGGDTKLG